VRGIYGIGRRGQPSAQDRHVRVVFVGGLLLTLPSVVRHHGEVGD